MCCRLVLMLPWNSCAIGTAQSMISAVASINRMRNDVRLKPALSACWRDLALRSPSVGSSVVCSDDLRSDVANLGLRNVSKRPVFSALLAR